MIRHLSKNDFIEMPWKNGQGTTLELFRLSSGNSNSFWFRISMAAVNSDGPFSIFPQIDRSLFLVSGNGLILENSGKEARLTEKWKAFQFAGEDQIHCRLINGPCQDFNIMVDRRFGKVETTVFTTSDYEFKCLSDFTFIYNVHSHLVIVLEKGDLYHFSSNRDSLLVICYLNQFVSTR